MKITGDEIIELMFLPMSDDKVVEAIDKLGWEQPTLDEEYEIEQEVCIIDEENTGVTFVFKELDGYSIDGEPCLVEIDFVHDEKTSLPFNLSFLDSYTICCKKLGDKAIYNHKRIKNLKIWILKNRNIKHTIAIHFQDDSLQKIKYIVLNKFEENRIGSIYIENKE